MATVTERAQGMQGQRHSVTTHEQVAGYLEYLPHLEVSPAMAAQHPNNCAVIERTADGVNVGACWFYLTDGITCPRHGVVKRKKHAPAH